ncbi:MULTISPECIES: hypothetical protein [unclassified Mesorhizobium]|uniref:hypothetical protein n=1 Tax=unclassified Mesorhizobium TaxID=325217 RepID=UPI0003CF81ED|nr:MULTISPECIES: hypothetical protein [unclassified Mesorhizobium]ESY45966.1 hypothetical protein X745_31335 [Mesorhizobium sp. LNJC374B00]ESY51178.1 hypothetical protein X744_31450 [Mesorhizobium sp. LNJC372A00]WJI80960.1 hypothetical protein NLY34_29960 [Mesorhizobium sp. C374B]WJI87499.1 hypothetical protein NLY42_00710 [Mesorhizobium sp. C372A]
MVDSTAALLEEMGHQVTEIEPPFAFEEFIRIMLSFSDLGASSLEASGRAMGRTINAHTLEPVTLKLYERACLLVFRSSDASATKLRLYEWLAISKKLSRGSIGGRSSWQETDPEWRLGPFARVP